MIITRALSISDHKNEKFLQFNGHRIPIIRVQMAKHFCIAFGTHSAIVAIQKEKKNAHHSFVQNYLQMRIGVFDLLKFLLKIY